MRGTFAAAFDKVAILAGQIALVPIFIGHWGVETYGAWVLLSTVPIYLALSDLGFGLAAGTDMTMATARGDRAGALSTYQSIWLLVVAASAVLVLAALAVIWSLPARVFEFTTLSDREARLTLTAFLSFAVAGLQNNIVNSGLRAIGAFALSRVASGWMFSGEAIAMIVAVDRGGGPFAAAAAMASVRAVGTAVLYLMQIRRARWLHFGWGAASFVEVKRLTPAALASMSLFGSDALVLQGSSIAVGAAAGPAGVVVFTTVRTLSRIGTQLAGLLTHPLLPEFSVVATHDDHPAMARMTLATLFASMVFVVPMALGLLLFGQHVVAIWTRGAIAPPMTLIAVMAGVIVMNGLWSPLALLLGAVNRHTLYARAYLVGAVVTVAGAYGATRAIGPTGGAVAMLCLDALMVILVQRLIVKHIATRREIFAAFPTLIEALRIQIGRAANRFG